MSPLRSLSVCGLVGVQRTMPCHGSEHDTAGILLPPPLLDGMLTGQSKVTPPPSPHACIFATVGCPTTIRHREKEVPCREQLGDLGQDLYTDLMT